MKVLMMTDLEGVAGVVTFEQDSDPTGQYYETAKRLLTAEVNAAVDGLMEAGAEEVLVLDMHGPGGIWFEDLHPQAKPTHGRPLAPQESATPSTEPTTSPSSWASTRRRCRGCDLGTRRAAATSTATH